MVSRHQHCMLLHPPNLEQNIKTLESDQRAIVTIAPWQIPVRLPWPIFRYRGTKRNKKERKKREGERERKRERCKGRRVDRKRRREHNKAIKASPSHFIRTRSCQRLFGDSMYKSSRVFSLKFISLRNVTSASSPRLSTGCLLHA
jgi:hypothetical protein